MDNNLKKGEKRGKENLKTQLKLKWKRKKEEKEKKRYSFFPFMESI